MQKTYTRNILLVFSGMSPQVVTGTLYALLNDPKYHGHIPTEVHLACTQAGKEQASKLLLGAKGQFAKFCKDYSFSMDALSTNNIHVIRSRDDMPLTDIRTAENNEDMADFVLNLIRELSADPESRLHVSISGGRKTMSFFGGYALSLYGRPQDLLTHVLVSDNYEFIPEYFYPTPYSKKVITQSGQKLDAMNAVVELASIPFLRLRDTLPEVALIAETGFNDVLRKSQKSLSRPTLLVDYENHVLVCSGETLKIQRVLFGVYAWLYEYGGPVSRLDFVNETKSMQHAKSFSKLYEKLFDRSIDVERTTVPLLRDGMTAKWLEEKVSRINKAIGVGLGSNLGEKFMIKKVGIKSRQSYVVEHFDS